MADSAMSMADRDSPTADSATPAADKDTPTVRDTSCYHAALGNLLLAADPATPIASVLGGNAATAGRVLDDGLLFFDDPIPGFLDVLGRAGCRPRAGRLDIDEPARDLAELLSRGRPLAVSLDAFHVKHFWTEYQRAHMPHLVLIAGYDAADGSVHLADGVEPTLFDGRIDLTELAPALRDPDGARWVAAEPVTADEADLRALVLAAAAGLGDREARISGGSGAEAPGAAWLSALSLTEALASSLPVHLAAVRGLSAPPPGPDGRPDVGRPGNILRGLGSVHANLRWLARGLAGVGAAAGIADSVLRASREVLIIRALLSRTDPADPGSATPSQRLVRHVERAYAELVAASDGDGGLRHE